MMQPVEPRGKQRGRMLVTRRAEGNAAILAAVRTYSLLADAPALRRSHASVGAEILTTPPTHSYTEERSTGSCLALKTVALSS